MPGWGGFKEFNWLSISGFWVEKETTAFGFRAFRFRDIGSWLH